MLTRDLDRIREAYKRRHPEATRRAYNPSHPHQAEEKHTTTQDKHIKSIRYSGFDGTITTFTAASGVACASLSSGIVLMIRKICRSARRWPINVDQLLPLIQK